MRTESSVREHWRSAAFTLLEMVLVLAILTIMSAVAIRSMEGVDQQTRFEATQRTMDNVRRAVLDTARDADGSLLVSGFLADMGRLPKALGAPPAGSDPDSPLRMDELWTLPAKAAPFAVRSAPSDPEVLLGCGWRGNYLQLGVGASSVKDGWGHPFDLLQSDASSYAPDGDPVMFIRSRGADGAVDSGTTNGNDTDVLVRLGGDAPPNAAAGTATISGRIFQLDPSTGQLRDPDTANGDITVRYFHPDPNTGLLADDVISVLGAPAHSPVAPGQNPPVPPFAYSVTATTGPRVLRAYQGKPDARPTFKSVPVRLMVQPGGQTKDLVLMQAANP